MNLASMPLAETPLERLKKILRQALQAQVQRIKLQDGQVVEVLTGAGAGNMEGEGAIDQEYVQKLYSFLFPHDKAALATRQTIKGALNVPNVGKILLIAQPVAPISLRLYLPPDGTALFESDWARVSSKTVAPDMTAPPPAQHAPTPGVFDMFGGPPPAAPSSMPPMPQVSAPPAQAQQAPALGFDPAAFAPLQFAVSPSDPAPAPFPGLIPPMMPATPMIQPMPEPMAQSVEQAPSLVMSPVINMVQPEPAPPLTMPVVRPVAPAPLPIARTESLAVDDDGEISWSADAPGSSAVSDGNNPIDQVLIDMVKRKASDLHMTSGEPLCFRLDGEIVRISTQPMTADDVARFLLPIFPARNKAEFIKINDTDFAYEIRGVGRFRVNIFRDRMGVGSVMRHIPSKILTAEQLGLPPGITKFCQLTKGLVLVTGPTGSGKSTTLAAMVDLINKNRHDHILTVEDPIEFVHPQQNCLVNQREVHKHTTSFARALKAALREDPDIVLIGEMRDLETVAIAIETAETGHLVFGTLHTNTAVSTIDRIVDQFPTDRQEQIRMMLSNSLKGVVAQTLLKKKGGGRVAAHEILVTNDAVSAMIREGKNHMVPNHMQSQKQDGNILLNESLFRLVKDNIVEAHDAMMKAVDKSTLLEMFRRGGIKYEAVGLSSAPAVPPPKPGTKSA